MALFSEGNLEAVGIKLDTKLRLCSVCGTSLQYIAGEGYCCPNGHGCWWPQQDEADKTFTHPAAVYRGGAVIQGVRAGNEKSRQEKTDWAGMYGDS